MRGSLRSRLFAYIALGALVSTALTVLVAAVLVSHRTQAEALNTLDRQADALAGLPRQGGPTTAVYATKAGPVGAELTVVSGQRARLILARVPAGGDHSGGLSLPAARLLYSERDGPSGRVVLVRSARLVRSDAQPFVLSLILAGLAGLMLSAGLAFVLARRLVGPLDALARATEGVAASRDPVEVTVGAGEPRELVSLARSFNLMSRDLADAQDAQRSFLMSVGHELKTPLTAIAGYAEGLQDGAVEPLSAGDVIGAEAARLDRLITDLLDLARINRDTFTVSREPVMLLDIAAELLERYGPQAAKAGVGLRLVEHDQPERPVLADHGRVLQAASNLVENAVRVTPAGGRVELRVRDGALTVRDTGPGLDAGDLPHAFDRFYLHRKLPVSDRPGSGLGLAIVSQLAHAMGGTARVTSERGRGSEFTIELPSAGPG